MEEVWRVISDSDGHYYISNMGIMKRDEYEVTEASTQRRESTSV